MNKMKMRPEHYAQLRTAMRSVDETALRGLHALYHDRPADFRWTLFLMAPLNGLSHELWEYLGDRHIDTALRRIVDEMDVT